MKISKITSYIGGKEYYFDSVSVFMYFLHGYNFYDHKIKIESSNGECIYEGNLYGIVGKNLKLRCKSGEKRYYTLYIHRNNPIAIDKKESVLAYCKGFMVNYPNTKQKAQNIVLAPPTVQTPIIVKHSNQFFHYNETTEDLATITDVDIANILIHSSSDLYEFSTT